MNRDNKKSTEDLRRRAEKRLQQGKQKTVSTVTQAELQRLVHELEVHQIELEMQNEELRQARSDLEAHLREYTDLYDFAPVGYFTLDPDGLILRANLTGVRMLGVERSRFEGQHFERFVTSDSRRTFRTVLAEVYRNQSQEALTIGLETKTRGKLIVHVEAMVSNVERGCRIALVDITAQEEAKELLRESERRYRTLFENMSQGVVQLDADGKIISANPAAGHILNLSIHEIQAGTWGDLFSNAIHEDRSDFLSETHPPMAALRTGTPVRDVVLGVSPPGSDGYVWLNINAVPQVLPNDNNLLQVFVTFEDITYRKRMEIYSKLTAREKEVFRLLAKGLSRQVIAEALKISPKTVDKHRENLMHKMHLDNNEAVLRFARLIGVVEE